MIALLAWMVLPPGGMTTAEHDVLPEEVSRLIEIVDGAVVVLPSPLRSRGAILRSLPT